MIYLTFFVLFPNLSFCTLSKGGPSIFKDKEPHHSYLPFAHSDVWDLIKSDFEIKDILNNHKQQKSEGEKKREQTYLGYVTPWNSIGSEYAINNSKKFSLISPTWFEAYITNDIVTFTDLTLINQTFLDKLRSKNSNLKITPRIAGKQEFYENLFSSQIFNINHDYILNIATQIIEFLKKHNFDGFVFECLINLQDSEAGNEAIEILKEFARIFTSQNYIFIYVIPPLILQDKDKFGVSFTKQAFDKVLDSVSYFSLMTYDYSMTTANFISPLPWIETTVEYYSPYYDRASRSKILMGINLYGRILDEHYNDINGEKFINLLNESSKEDSHVEWYEEAGEHIFHLNTNSEEIMLTYPTLKSITDRLELAESLGTGVAFWELGQALRYFFELL